MKPLASIALLLCFASLVRGNEFSLQAQWSRKDLSADQRDELVELSKKESFQKISPILLKVIGDGSQYPLCYSFPLGKNPWNHERLSSVCRTYLMALAVWGHHMSPPVDPTKAKILFALLQDSKNDAEKKHLLSSIKHRQWIEEAEQVFSRIAKDREESSGVRGIATHALLERCDINSYMPLAIEIVQSQKKLFDRIQIFHSLTNLGNRLFSLTEKNKQLVLSIGFEILSELPDEDLQHGYFVARRLGYILEMENDFVPDQKAEKYQGKQRLKEEFYSDTTKNALNWYSANLELFPTGNP